jgi:hypothetical protein
VWFKKLKGFLRNWHGNLNHYVLQWLSVRLLLCMSVMTKQSWWSIRWGVKPRSGWGEGYRLWPWAGTIRITPKKPLD